MPVWTVSQRFSHLQWRRLFKELWGGPTKTADFGSSFCLFFTPTTFACWKIRFTTEVCICSHFPSEALLWIKEVELVESMDESRSSSSTRGISMPILEVLDARIASALNKISHDSVKNSANRFTVSLRNDDIQEFDSKWDGILLSMTKIPPDDILEGLYKL